MLPRILTQICRDPGAPFYGACDRNWWHYKIRDFPSIILQQAGYALAIAANLSRGPHASSVSLSASCGESSHLSLLPLAAATARFWNQRALLHGAFEEYYPYEQGYPPVAFATLATAKLCHMDAVRLTDIHAGLAVASKQLLSRFEAQAANQQIAGTAALSVIRTIAPDLVNESAFQKILSDILALQHQEGWFPEYDGPDLGYLAVSIDCLWDIHDHTQDPRILPAIRRAADYIAWFALSPLGAAGMHNSRNTDYFTPYGLVRLALEDNNAAAVATVQRLFTRQAQPVNRGPLAVGGGPLAEDEDALPGASDLSPLPRITDHRSPGTSSSSPISNLQSPISFHYFDSIDDRYWCHYIGHSVLRALALLEKAESADRAGSALPPPTAHRSQPTAHSLPGSGHALLTSPSGATALVSTRKGGIVTAVWPDGSTVSDFGWLVQTPDKLLVSHWWSTDWQIDITAASATTQGWLVAHKELTSEPWKHILLRIASYTLGRRLIKILKRLVIFKKPLQSHHFCRTITWDGDTLVINDTLTGLSDADTLTRAPRTSKRHVASADSFHPEDLALLHGVKRTEQIERTGSVFRCESRFRVANFS